MQGISAQRCPTATPSVHPRPRTAGQPQGTWLGSLGDLHLPTRDPEPGCTRSFPRGKSPAPGHNRVRQERDISVLGSGLLGSRLLGYAHRAAWGQLRMELIEPCAHSGRAASEEQRPTCFPPPAPGTCAVALFGPHCLGAGRWRCPRQVGHGKSLSTRPLQMASSHPPPCFAEQLLWVTRTVAMGYPTEEAGSMRGMAGACGLLIRGPRGWGLSYKEGPGKRRNPRAMTRRACWPGQHLHFSLA